ncbi:DUF4396 domain-containing protein [Granulicella tundricola]|nr:DUF4396 domain-containing protein [Granulicella tundricola]
MFELIAWISLGLAFVSAAVIVIDEVRHPQKMGVMNIVWPATALYFSVFAVWAYFVKGRGMARDAVQGMEHEEGQSPTWAQTALAGSHCGAGCVLADVVTEFVVFGVGLTLFGKELYASYLWDFVAAWLIGVAFQYFAIKPMRDLTVAGGIWAAVKADTLSILTFQIGMYGWMAVVFFKLFPGPHLHPNDAGYWLMMQIAMVCGFVTALPVNWLLVKIGWKEAMG